MNERIELLAEQASQWVIDNSNGVHAPYERWNEKFAELIIRECAGIYSKIDNGNSHMGTDDYLEALHRTFFGVKE